MLINFSVKNYKSFKEKTTLNFIASSIKGNDSSNIITKNKLKILKSIAVYGPNASGKSNLLDAIVLMRWLVINSSKNTQANEKIDVNPHRLNPDTENEPSEFEAEFQIGKVRYRYGFSADKLQIHKEWLFEQKKTKEYPCFLRKEQEIKVWDRFKEGKSLEDKTRKNALFVSVVSQFNGLISNKVINWFNNITPIQGLNPDDFLYYSKTIEFLIDEETGPAIKKLITNADFGIQDIRFNPNNVDEIKEMSTKHNDQNVEEVYGVVETIHHKYDNNGLRIGQTVFNLDKDESEGTKKFFSIIGLIYESIINDKIVIIDELDARFHTLLTLSIVQIFNSELNTNSQLLFTSHDTNLIRKDLLRRDQLFLVEKNQYSASDLKSFVEFKPRKDAALEKKYLDGDFGGIPIIESLIEV